MSYTNDTKYAAENLISLSMDEHEALIKINSSLEEAKVKFSYFYWNLMTVSSSEDISDAQEIMAFRQANEAKVMKDELEI